MNEPQENEVIIDGQRYYGGLNQPNLKFIKVNIHCWENIFDFLSLSDILAMCQTCQRMRQIGGLYFQENFHGNICYLRQSSGLCVCIAGVDKIEVEHDDFCRFVDTLKVHYFELERLRTVSSMGLLTSLTTLQFRYINLNKHQLHGFENVQLNIETIELFFCSIVDNFVGEFLASCTKLRSLRFSLVDFRPSPTIRASIFRRTYPMLEHFEYTRPKSSIPLISFLERNPNIKSLQIEVEDLQTIPFDITTVQLDYLNIDIRGKVYADELSNQLQMLYANKFFTKLRLSVDDLASFHGETFFSEMISFDALEVLEAFHFFTESMNDLVQLKELQLYLKKCQGEMELETMAMNLINLERLRISGTVDQLSSFLRHSKKLKFVFFEDIGRDFKALDLCNFNRLRQMAGVQRRVYIGAYENLYMATKRKENNQNYDLVGITRAEKIYKHFYYKRF